MEPIEKEKTVFKTIDPILKAIDEIIPTSWTRAQVAAVLSAYIEIYR